MKECSIHDIVRICEAVVLSDVDGHGRELIIGLFARQVVKVLNQVLENEDQNDSSINIGSASSSEVSTLIWALGEMGVNYYPVDHGKQPTNKKMNCPNGPMGPAWFGLAGWLWFWFGWLALVWLGWLALA